MMMGTPARPGMTRTGLVSAKAVPAVPIKIASANPTRIVRSPGVPGNLTECPALRVKAPRQISDKPNACLPSPYCKPWRCRAPALRGHRCDNRRDADRNGDDADGTLQ